MATTHSPKKPRAKRPAVADEKQHLLVVRVVQYTFMAGLVSTAVITINKDAADAIRAVWGIFTPILTLVIGYYFGNKNQ